jgi:hypothetical protein
MSTRPSRSPIFIAACPPDGDLSVAYIFEPSARVYALWESEKAYTDSLGTAQAERNFTSGRASGGAKVSYPIARAGQRSVLTEAVPSGYFREGRALGYSRCDVSPSTPSPHSVLAAPAVPPWQRPLTHTDPPKIMLHCNKSTAHSVAVNSSYWINDANKYI